jgi:hypothetical protein
LWRKIGSDAHEPVEIDGREDEQVEDDNEGGAEISCDEAVAEHSSSSSATAEPSRDILEGI